MSDLKRAANVLGSTLNPAILQRLQSTCGGRASRVKRRQIPREGESVEQSGPVRIIPVPGKAA